MPGSEKDLSRVLNEWLDNKLFEIHTCIPGKFVSYSSSERKAKVQPLVKPRDNKNDTFQIDPIDNVPVIFPGTNNFNLLFPISNGDGCLILFSETSIGNFLNGTGDVVDADDSNRFELTDCIAIPGLWGFKNIPSPTNKIELNNAGKITINCSLFDMLAATESFLKGDTWKTNWVAFNTTIQTATSGTTAQNAAGINTIKSAFATFAGLLTNMLSTKIKGE